MHINSIANFKDKIQEEVCWDQDVGLGQGQGQETDGGYDQFQGEHIFLSQDQNQFGLL